MARTWKLDQSIRVWLELDWRTIKGRCKFRQPSGTKNEGNALARARWKSQQEDRWQHQRGPANGNRQVPWQTDRTQWHRSWAAKTRKVSQNKKRTCLPPAHQGDLAPLCQGPVGEAGPQRWTQAPRKPWFKNKNHRPREIPLVSTFKSHNIKITKVSGFQIKEDPTCWAKELALYSEAMAATEGFWRDQKNNITNNSRGLESDPDWNAGFSLAGLVMW